MRVTGNIGHTLGKGLQKAGSSLLQIFFTQLRCHRYQFLSKSLNRHVHNEEITGKCKLQALPLRNSFLNAGQVILKECQRKQVCIIYTAEKQGDLDIMSASS